MSRLPRTRGLVWTVSLLVLLSLGIGLAVRSLAQPTVPVTITGVGGAVHGTCMLGGTSVKDFGAVGDNVADDTVAIQAAVDATAAGGLVCFPQGTYKVTAPLLVMTATKRLALIGVGSQTGGTHIVGSVDGAIFQAEPATGTDMGVVIEKMYVRNTHPTGTAIQYGRFTSGAIRDVRVAGYRGIVARTIFSLTIENVKFGGSVITPGSIGLFAGGHTTVIGSDITSWDEGIRAAAVTVNILGCRLEINNTGLVVGRDLDGTTFALSRSVISGNSFEANGTAIDIVAATQVVVEGIAIQGSVNAPGGESHYGVIVRNSTDLTMQSVNVSGRYDTTALFFTGTHTRGVLSSVSTGNTFPNGQRWTMTSPPSQFTMNQTDFQPRGDGSVLSNVVTDRALRALAQVSHHEPYVVGKNLRGKNVAVGTGASTLAVTFQTALDNPPLYAIGTATPGSGAGTLPEGTYYYIASAVSEAGESGASGEKVATVTAPNNQVALTLGGGAMPRVKRRIYRGTSSGVYTGYFETALGATTFTDTGTAFTGLKSPVNNVPDDTTMLEPNANYAVIATPNWGTTVWVTNKATTGFTLNFGTAAPANAAADWFIVR